MKYLLTIFIFAVGVQLGQALEQRELSLDDLMALEVNIASLTGTSTNKVPASLTVITRDDIDRTPARHILDLLEVYVPGAFWEGHSEMGHPGIRGIIADRNGKFLLLVNGHRMNQDAHSGAVSEIENYDLGDVERIEVIRGPGSVIYGPGAIMGVINVITKRAPNAPGWRTAVMGNWQYRQSSASVSYGGYLGDVELFSYFSVTRTLGQKNTRVFIAYDSSAGYVGRDLREVKEGLNDTLPDGSLKPQGIDESSNYFADYWDTPQIKAQLDLGFWKELRLITRFTNSGNVQLLTVGNASKTYLPEKGRFANSTTTRVRQFSSVLEDVHEFSSEVSLKSSLEWNTQDFARLVIRNVDDLFSLENYTHSFSESRGVGKILARWTPNSAYKFAVGAEYSRTRISSPWFENASMLRLGDASNMFGDTSESNPAIYRGEGKVPTGYVAPSNAVLVGSSWDTYMGSVFGEANLEFHPFLNLILSGRAEKQEYAGWAYSPKISWISEWNRSWLTRFTAQRSVRVNFLEQGYMEELKGDDGKPEVLKGYEGMVGWMPNQDVKISMTGFLNRYELLGFSRADSATVLVGDLQTLGGEFEVQYSASRIQVGANHAVIKQLDFSVSEESKGGSGISYADFYPTLLYKGDTIVMEGYGNHLNNWPDQYSKLFFNWQFHPLWNLHFDSRIAWGFPGGKDGLVVYSRNAENFPESDSSKAQRVWDVIAKLREKNFYEADFRLNASLQYLFSKRGSVVLFCQNLLGWNGNKRYPYDSGSIAFFSSRWQAIEEPRTVGVNLKYALF